ncbi:uncharacterized protein SPSK_04568 [Sporothrix schenckii 1099-18]|uniref:DUF6546 domain-containing protein n=1 Tax=Sporothrix schenckii 1099-18 TaxID=1397361 RepID=A0A0F2M412_SPOSC|nr:uncharacterized protein SPSK_04568 [Sporothrix schenckii 1099-18]KJR83515.1 hypothetical protein SPSK_04568 [Sporothrix schenckii 1099-18]
MSPYMTIHPNHPQFDQMHHSLFYAHAAGHETPGDDGDEEEVDYLPVPPLVPETVDERDAREATCLRNSQDLVVLAGRAAYEMPNLETLEIWQTCTAHASIFRYEAHPSPTVTFLGHTRRARDAWKKVAEARKGKVTPLAVRFEQLPGLSRNLRGSFCIYSTIDSLKLRDLVIDPVSLYAARWEECPMDRSVSRVMLGYT